MFKLYDTLLNETKDLTNFDLSGKNWELWFASHERAHYAIADESRKSIPTLGLGDCQRNGRIVSDSQAHCEENRAKILGALIQRSVGNSVHCWGWFLDIMDKYTFIADAMWLIENEFIDEDGNVFKDKLDPSFVPMTWDEFKNVFIKESK